MKKLKIIKRRIYDFVKWYKNHIVCKYEHLFMPFMYTAFDTLVFCVGLLGFVFILYQLNIIDFFVYENQILKWVDFKEIEFTSTFKDLVILQVSSTFLTTAIISFISSMEDKKVFGEKIITKLFGKNHLLFYFSFIVLYLLMIINIVFMIREEQASLLIIFFVTSILILIFIISKIGNSFISIKRYKNKLVYEYYNQHKNLVVNRVAPKDYNFKLLLNLKEETIKNILNKDLKYMEYIQVYKVILNKTLFNHSRELEEYHLRMIYVKSVVDDISEILEHFIIIEEVDRAIDLFIWLLDKFNYYNVFICFTNYNNIFDSIIEKLTDLKNEYNVKQFLNRISSLYSVMELQQHFALTNSFNYESLRKTKNYHIVLGDSLYFKKTYDKIYTNKYLSEKEKNNCYIRLLDIFRMSGFYCNNGLYDITNYSYRYKERKKRDMPICIIGQATSYLLLEMLRNKDEKNFTIFYNNMNIETREKNYAVHSLMLMLLKLEEDNFNCNPYCEYYGIDLEWCKQFLSNYKYRMFNLEKGNDYINFELIQNLKKDYEEIILINKKEYDEKNRYYHFGGYLSKFERDLIDTYFTYIANFLGIKDFKTSVNKKDKKYRKRLNIIKQYTKK